MIGDKAVVDTLSAVGGSFTAHLGVVESKAYPAAKVGAIGQLGAATQLDIDPVKKVRFGRTTNDSDFALLVNLGDGTEVTNHSLKGVGDTYLSGTNGNIGIGMATTPASKVDITGADASTLPVLRLTQLDTSEEFIELSGTSAADNSLSLVDAADLSTPGDIVGWYKISVIDSNDIADGTYYVPFYATPTA